jgi:NitT/TauT family transport system permease protein
VGEFLGARRGLGVMILNMNANLDTAGVFAVFVVLTGIGMIMYGSLRWVERRVTFWTRSSEKVIGL